MIVNSSPYCRVWRRIDGQKRKIVGKFGRTFQLSPLYVCARLASSQCLRFKRLLLEESYITFICEHIDDTGMVVASEVVSVRAKQRWWYVVSLFQHGRIFYSYCWYIRKTVEKFGLTFQRSHFIILVAVGSTYAAAIVSLNDFRRKECAYGSRFAMLAVLTRQARPKPFEPWSCTVNDMFNLCCSIFPFWKRLQNYSLSCKPPNFLLSMSIKRLVFLSNYWWFLKISASMTIVFSIFALK